MQVGLLQTERKQQRAKTKQLGIALQGLEVMVAAAKNLNLTVNDYRLKVAY